MLNESWWRSTRRRRSQALLVDLDVGEDVGAQELLDLGGPDGIGLGVVGKLCQLAGQVVGQGLADFPEFLNGLWSRTPVMAGTRDLLVVTVLELRPWLSNSSVRVSMTT